MRALVRQARASVAFRLRGFVLGAAREATGWWDWPEELTRERAADLASFDVTSFIAKYRT
jgi:hypothetical protein